MSQVGNQTNERALTEWFCRGLIARAESILDTSAAAGHQTSEGGDDCRRVLVKTGRRSAHFAEQGSIGPKLL